MAYISYSKLWEKESQEIISKKDKVQDMNINQLKLEVHDTSEENEKIKTNFEAVNDQGVINKFFLDENF